MDSNGNQRKRGGRSAKNTNEKSPSRNNEPNEDMEVSAVAISPTLEVSRSTNSAPISECRRSSRKKIIKFDVRDLLNKNRKTHKIQIEARIDSNAPTTSKAAATGGTETINSKQSSITSKEDLLSKHKTFLEKSAIFRRYSVSQEHKPPLPPLPLPPLLGKANDNKDSGYSGTSSCQEFLSHVLIKPKEPTSLIVAQIESNTPSSVTTAKRKNLCKSLEMDTKTITNSEIFPVIQQKKRGRPAKIKTQTFVGTHVPITAQEDLGKKKITPEKAKNWKEYKACLAQQSSSTKEEKKIYKKREKAILISEHQKQVDDTLQSDISRSDDDGNFSGFQTSKDDLSCDSPLLAKVFSVRGISTKESGENIHMEAKFASKDVQNIGSIQSNERYSTLKTKIDHDGEFHDNNDVISGKNQLLQLDISKPAAELMTENVVKVELEETNETTQKENQNKNLGFEKTESYVENVTINRSNTKSSDSMQNKETESEIDLNTSRIETNIAGEKSTHYKQLEKSKAAQDIQKSLTISHETEIINNTAGKHQIKDNINDIPSNTVEVKNNKIEKIEDVKQKVEIKELCKTHVARENIIKTTSVESSAISKTADMLHEVRRELKTHDISDQVLKLTSYAKVDVNDMFVVTKQTPLLEPSTYSNERKSFSRTSSSSESENASERSSYSSEPFSTMSSSSPSSSYKSGDKLMLSVKRISLPKSPSTSSQTSTSEEFISADVLKRKPPLGKRSKRLQKKPKETSDFEDAIENIDNYFRRTPNDDHNVELNLDKPISIENIKLYVEDKIVVEPSEFVKKSVAKPVTKTAQDCNESSEVSEITDTLSNESSNVESMAKKKSSRSRKHNKTFDKVSEEKQLQLEKVEGSCSNIEHQKQQKVILNETKQVQPEEHNLENCQNKSVAVVLNLQCQSASVSGESHMLEDNDHGKNPREFKSATQPYQKQIKKSSSATENHMENKQEVLNIHTENATENSRNVENKEKEVPKISKEGKLNKLNETITVIQATKASESTTDIVISGDTSKNASMTNEEDISTNDIELQSMAQVNLKDTDNRNIGQNSEENDVESRNEAKASASKLTEYITEDFPIKESKKQDEHEKMPVKDLKLQISNNNDVKKNKSEVIQTEITEGIRESSKFLTRTDNTNKEEILAEDIKFQDKKHASDEIKETGCLEHSVQLSERKCDKEDKAISHLIQVAILESTQDKTSDENSYSTDKSTAYKKEEQFTEIMNVETLHSCQSNIEIPNEKSNLTSENIDPIKSEKVMTAISTRSRSTKENISIKDDCSTHFATVENEDVKKVETSSIPDIRKTLKEEGYSPKICKNLQDNHDVKLLEENLADRVTENLLIKAKEAEAGTTSRNNKTILLTDNKKDLAGVNAPTQSKMNKPETLSTTRKKSTSKIDIESPELSSEKVEKSTVEKHSPSSSIREVPFDENSKSSQDANLAVENIRMEKSVDTINYVKLQLSLPTSSTEIVLKHADAPKRSQEESFVDKSLEMGKQVELKKETCSSNTQQANDRQISIRPSKRRGRKSRFKNLHGPEVDSETDSSNGKNTPIDEISHEKLDTETKKIQEDGEIQNSKSALETDTEVCETEKEYIDVNAKGEPIPLQENVHTNFLSSQIKNVSIETNTLLDILRTVQSNTKAALKSTKPLINIVRKDNEHEMESTTKLHFDESSKNSQDSLKIQCESETASTTILDTESSLAVQKHNISPGRSDSVSPFNIKKVISSPTRSNSSSPMTLKKVTRRYERRSRRMEGPSHKTLEETFAEIAAQSSKAVLAAKEFDTGEHQTENDKSQKDPDFIEASQNIEKDQIKENFEEVEKNSGLGQTALNVEQKVDEDVLNISQDLDKAPLVSNEVEINKTESVIGVEAAKLTPPRRGRKPKNQTLDVSITESKEILEINNLPKTIEEKCITQEVVKENKIHMETESAAIKENETKTFKKVNESLETTQIADLTDDKDKSSFPLQLHTQDHSKESLNLSETNIEEIAKPFEDGGESKLCKKFKKRENKTALEDSLLPKIDTCKDKEGEVLSSKQAMKKRDSALSKSEIKSVVKKMSKKTKNEEENSLNLQKEETLAKAAATTPPSSKRGRKFKNQQLETSQTSSKKKNKKYICTKDDDEDTNVENAKLLDSESDSLNNSSEKSFDEKLAKRKRQKKLKEAFEAALTDDKEKYKSDLQAETSNPTNNSSLGLTFFNSTPPPEKDQTKPNEDGNESIKVTCMTPVQAEEDLDPLKDIEKFIADGVNLLKKDYKLDEDSVDDVMQNTPSKTKILDEPVESINDEAKHIFNTFETPADTPINTPSATPPPKSPTSVESTTPDENSGVRRSHRIKLITKTPKALVGRGLVRDRERFSIKDDVETKSHYSIDDHLTDLAEVEAKNAKFLKEMEERLSNFQVIKENDYLCERVISREARKMICDCFLTHEEEERGELGCGEDCLNRLLMIECGPECNVKERCTNKRFQKLLCSPCRVFRTEKKGFGILADIEILPGEFIMEYVGEVIDTEEFEKRRIMYSLDKNRHYYFMALRSDAIIDATIKGNISRFINHSCDPNAETQKWTVNGELRIGFFSRKSIMPGEEITFNYQYQRYGREAQRCYCESANCRGWIGQEPTSDEGEQVDDEDDESEDEEEETDTSNLLVHDDDEDSDASVADPEEVQKQLEMAAAQAEVELAPLQLLDGKVKQTQSTTDEGKSLQDLNKSDNEEDSKSKFKKLLSKMAEKVAAKQKQNKREQKLQRKKKSKGSSSELTNKLRFLEDPDIEDEVEFLKECGLKNQSDTLRLSRLMVRAKLVQTRLNLLEILRKGDFPCRRLFLDYHGLRLLHGWMSEDGGNMQIRLSLLQTLETLPIANKTVLTDSKVMQVVRNWCGTNTNLLSNEDSSSSNSNSQDAPVQSSTTFEDGSEMVELQKLSIKLISTWEGLPEIFRIPKKERIEQMKEHEREADRQYAANAEIKESTTSTDRYRRNRFGRGLNTSNNTLSSSNRFIKPNNGILHKTANTTPENVKNLSKAQRREMFAAKVARDEAEKRLAEERREFETKCRFFGLDPKKTRAQDIPFCVNPGTGQWFSIERKPISTPPSYAHVQVPIKPKSTDPNDYQLPAACSNLPSQWKYAITPQGKIYYYHIKHRISQWEPPSAAQLQQCEVEAAREDSESEISTTAGEDSSDDDDDILIGMDAAQLKAYIDRKVEVRRQKRYQRLVDQRSISPRREEDRIYNQIEVRKYKENKEKIRKRKEDIRRKRAEALRQISLNMCTLGSISDTNTNKGNTENEDEMGALPIQDYLLSSDEEVDIKAEVNSPLIDKIVEGDKIVDELDALTTKRQLKRPLPPHRDFNEPSTSASVPTALVAAKQEYKKRKLEKKEKRKPKEQDAKYRKNKEKFRCEIAGIIVHHLKPYLKETCALGRIQSNEDFNHLARKLTHFVMIKELKYCESVGQTLVVTESVKSKSREFIKKYMAKYGDVYIKPTNDPDFKDIPFTL